MEISSNVSGLLRIYELYWQLLQNGFEAVVDIFDDEGTSKSEIINRSFLWLISTSSFKLHGDCNFQIVLLPPWLFIIGAKLMVFYKIMVMMLKKSHLASKILNECSRPTYFFGGKRGSFINFVIKNFSSCNFRSKLQIWMAPNLQSWVGLVENISIRYRSPFAAGTTHGYWLLHRWSIVQGPPWQSGFFKLPLTNRNMQVRFC